jgi:hypothetical protein
MKSLKEFFKKIMPSTAPGKHSSGGLGYTRVFHILLVCIFVALVLLVWMHVALFQSVRDADGSTATGMPMRTSILTSAKLKAVLGRYTAKEAVRAGAGTIIPPVSNPEF